MYVPAIRVLNNYLIPKKRQQQNLENISTFFKLVKIYNNFNFYVVIYNIASMW
jgi:hypothetical protein